MDIEQKNEVIESKTVVKLNPWTTIMFKPRATMRYILDTDPGKVFLLICLVMFIDTLIYSIQGFILNSFVIGIFWRSVVVSVIAIPAAYYLLPLLYKWIGDILGGKGTTKEMRYVVGYTYIPSIYSSLIFMFFQIIASFSPELSVLPFVILSISISIWIFIVSLKCLSEAHQFSVWRALSTMIIIWIIIIVSVVLIGFALFTLIALT
ncbi:Yip1 family protein [Chengkuizengella sediminis]|uniref:Yip1 family protein n=1 Tax=Chengkuizengella sediminis TaxID=1885917 RepID=UPI001389490D|nr:Yip1 family protein [Chengkuizengella sediminis]NDI33627.1 YIP1 family protein [Chengkuizengella sediminis]